MRHKAEHIVMHIIKEGIKRTVSNSASVIHTGLYDDTQLKDTGKIFNTDKYVVYTHLLF
jgi:hypothetical protein